MIIKSHLKEYCVHHETDDSFIERLKTTENAFWIIDKKVYELYPSLFADLDEKYLFLLEATEDNKTMDRVLQICEKMTALAAKRNIHLISVGGGITQDVTGVVANLLYRGIRWSFVPTTLLAACDSCIGGKTSLNYKEYKNLLGTFYPPDDIYIAPGFFGTLSQKDYESGLGEVVKFNIMYGEEGLDRIKKDMPLLLVRDAKTVREYVEKSLLFKKDFIEQDEFDRGVRVLLNFAHTFGHAIEKVSAYEVPHGTAVAMGTIVANEISKSRNLLPENIAAEIESLMRDIIHITYTFTPSDMEDLLNAIGKDKKQIGNSVRAVLFRQDMTLQVFDDVKREEVEKAYLYLFDYLDERG